MAGDMPSDRDEIHEVVLRYCRGIDRLDMELVRSAYHRDGIDHHTGFDGSVDEFVVWVEAGLRRLEGTMHLVANHLAEIVGEHAVAETYGQAVHWSQHEAGNFTTGFRYVDAMERRGGRWAITERWAVREWIRADTPLPARDGVTGPVGRRDDQDPLYRALDQLRNS
jgi:hypothetical protein